MEKPYDRYCVYFFSTLANPLRLAILHSLLRSEKNVTELVKDIGEERTLISHNLAMLLKTQLIFFKRKGKERIYYPNEKVVVPLFFLIKNFVCSKCSFRKTCKILEEKGRIPEMEMKPIPNGPCSACK